MILPSVLSSLVTASVLAAPPAQPGTGGEEGPGSRGYDGVGALESTEKPAAPSGATPEKPDTPGPGSDDGELSMDDVFGSPEPEQSPAATGTAPTKPAAEGPAESGDLSMDDIFGDGSGSTPSGPKPAAAANTAPAPTPTDAPGKKKLGQRLKDSTDFRLRILTSAYYSVDRVETRGFDRQENRVEAYVSFNPNRHIEIVGGVEAVFMGVAQAQELDDLATRQMLTPFHFESDAAYVAVHDLLPGLSLKLGRQIVVWGTADKFNPTNNLNPDDLEDRPLFTEPIANQMAVLEYSHPKLGDKLMLQAVYVPFFYPALLPPSAAAGLKDPYSELQLANQEDREAFLYLQDTFLPLNPKLVPNVIGHVNTPDLSFQNGQFGFKIGSTLGPVDLSASYYYGRHDIPFPVKVESTPLGNLSEDPPEGGFYIQSDVDLIYPKMQVVGLDIASQLPFLGDMGIWGEAALFIPEPHEIDVEFPIAVDVTPDDGMANPIDGVIGTGIRSRPYVKATAGLDYTIGKHVYLQAQYLRGFIDEFGADHIGDYVVGGTELVFFGRHLIFRLFGLVDFPHNNDPGEGTSGVIAPAILATLPWGYVSFELGGFAFLSKTVPLANDEERFARTKFGQSGVGSSIVYLKAIGSF